MSLAEATAAAVDRIARDRARRGTGGAATPEGSAVISGDEQVVEVLWRDTQGSIPVSSASVRLQAMLAHSRDSGTCWSVWSFWLESGLVTGCDLSGSAMTCTVDKVLRTSYSLSLSPPPPPSLSRLPVSLYDPVRLTER